ncbi:MAG TPA: SUMF1/EgtB/PvdO family nonheme iron enzyme [Polyangiaceae bacterium]|jgi:formylglycine-generating enzyme required for sulfatase activity|nr:SUMF1/EgtB/PvdO family nonheme iron enzyme [Polyangiaceae bacterium]
MRAAALAGTALLLCTLVASTAVSAPPRPRRPAVTAPAPSREAPTPSSLVSLKAPGPDAILIRAGTFLMGSDEGEILHALEICRSEPAGSEEDVCRDERFLHEYAAHPVYLSDYWIDRTEVTVARYRQCVAAGRCLEPPYASGAERFDRPDMPVVLVSWNDASAFCAFAGGRLPTEAEWERAARGEKGRRYPWGNVWNPLLSNHGRLTWDPLDGGDGFLEIAPVGSFPDGRTPDGILDLAGNVDEWVLDYYAPDHPRVSAVNPRGPDAGNERVVKGGSYASSRPWLRGASRDHSPPGVRRTTRGFRCARPHDPAPAQPGLR